MVNITASGLNETVPPQIYVNGTRATYVSSRYLANGLTSSKILTYSVLESVYDDKYFILEITPTAANLTVDYATVYIERPAD